LFDGPYAFDRNEIQAIKALNQIKLNPKKKYVSTYITELKKEFKI